LKLKKTATNNSQATLTSWARPSSQLAATLKSVTAKFYGLNKKGIGNTAF